MPTPLQKEFRDDVVGVACPREQGMTIKRVAKDFGIFDSCLTNWITQADRDAGRRPVQDPVESHDLREAKRRIRLLEQENQVLPLAAASLSQADIAPQ